MFESRRRHHPTRHIKSRGKTPFADRLAYEKRQNLNPPKAAQTDCGSTVVTCWAAWSVAKRRLRTDCVVLAAAEPKLKLNTLACPRLSSFVAGGTIGIDETLAKLFLEIPPPHTIKSASLANKLLSTVPKLLYSSNSGCSWDAV